MNDTFTVSSARSFLDNTSLPNSMYVTRCNFLVPNKLNVLLWWIKLNRIPTRLFLSQHGLELISIFYPVCEVSSGVVQPSFYFLPKVARSVVPY